MDRAEILQKAEQCVNGQREPDYGSPEDNFETIAKFWNTYIKASKSWVKVLPDLNAKDVAVMMALLKIARIAGGGGSGDSYVDLAGYAACAGEIWSKNEETVMKQPCADNGSTARPPLPGEPDYLMI